MTRRKKKEDKDSVLYSPLEISDNLDDGSKTNLKKRRKKRRKRDEEPFLITNLKVGSVIAIICALIYSLYIITSMALSKFRGNDEGTENNLWSKYVNDDAISRGYAGGVSGEDEKSKIFPNFDINDEKINAYNAAKFVITQNEHGKKKTNNGQNERDPNKKAIVESLEALEEVKQEFASLYGGENAAKEILSRGVTTFQPSYGANKNSEIEGIRKTARRIFHARSSKMSFKISFAGSSAVAGYGNYLKQTFPSVIAGILTEPIEKLGMVLEVRNAAIADIASFPYGWCLDNFMGKEVDVVSWDSSLMNRADTDAAFESYLRRIVSMESSPMLIVREGVYSESRRQIIQK